MSNCWLLLLSPQLQNFFQERNLSPTNALLLSVLVEVSCVSTVLSKTNHARVRSQLCSSPPPLCLQHVLILVKLILRILIPDEPTWIRKKREHIEFMSMQALKQQVCSQTFNIRIFPSFSEAEELYAFLLEPAAERLLTAFQGLGCCFTLSCVENCYNQKIEDRSTDFSVYCFREK